MNNIGNELWLERDIVENSMFEEILFSRVHAIAYDWNPKNTTEGKTIQSIP